MPAEDADGRAAVELVACERVPEGGEMSANLVAQGFRRVRLYEGPWARALLDTIAGRGRTRAVAHDVARVDARVDATLVLRVVGERKLDRAFVGEAVLRAHDGVGLVEALLFEGGLELVERRRIAGHHDEPGGVGVEAVHDAWLARRVADPGQVRVVPDEGVHEGAFFTGAQRGGGLPRRLVGDDDAAPLEPNHQRRVRLGLRGGVRVGDLREIDGDRLPRLNGSPLGAAAPVDTHRPPFDGVPNARARQGGLAFGGGGELGGGAVQAFAVQLGRNDQRKDLRILGHREHDSGERARTYARSAPAVDRGEVARTFVELATRFEIIGARPDRARIYRDFARRILRSRAADGPRLPPLDPTEASSLSRAEPRWLRKELDELLRDGRLAVLEASRATVPSDVARLAETKEIGPQVAGAIWRATQARTLGELADLLRAGFVPDVAGLGKTRRAKLEALLPAPPKGMLLAVAVDAGRIVEEILRDAGARKAVTVGDTRRGKEIVETLEVLAAGLSPTEVLAALRRADDALLVRDLTASARGVRCILQGRGPLFVRLTTPEDWPLALIRTTGDAAHVAWVEARALARGGLPVVARGAKTEREIYERLEIAPVAPELRDGITGPEPAGLLEHNAVRGAFHAHTDWSDGSSTIEAMAIEAARAGYEYLGISDHSRAAPYANGLDEARLASQKQAIRRARREVPGIEILHGLEVDILADGSLDLSDEALAELDFVIASVHTETRMDPAAMTERLLRALANPFVTILGHPTGRLLSGKAGYSFDVERVARAATANDTWIEINANGHRLDLSPALARRAYAAGARFAIDPDAHTPEGLFDVTLGERVARRAGLPADAIVNTLGARAMVDRLRKRRRRARARAFDAT